MKKDTKQYCSLFIIPLSILFVMGAQHNDYSVFLLAITGLTLIASVGLCLVGLGHGMMRVKKHLFAVESDILNDETRALDRRVEAARFLQNNGVLFQTPDEQTIWDEHLVELAENDR